MLTNVYTGLYIAAAGLEFWQNYDKVTIGVAAGETGVQLNNDYPSMNIHGPKKLMDTKNNQNLRRLICSGMIAMSEYFTVTTLKSSLA